MNNESNDYVQGIFWMLAASLSFAVMAACTKFAGQTVSAAQIVFVRSFAGALGIAAILFKKRISFIGKDPKRLLLRGLIGYVALQLYFWAIPQITLGTAVMLNYTAPIFAVLISYLFFRETPSRTARWALPVSFFGVYLLCSPEIINNAGALTAALFSGLFAGIVHVVIRQSHKDESPFTIIFYFMMTSSLGSSLLLAKSGFVWPSQTEWLLLAFITFSSFIGQIFLTFSLRKAPVWVVSPFGYITPVIDIFLGWYFWNEVPALSSLIGSSLVIICGILLYRRLSLKTPGE